jgi:hypothetical protein
MLSVEQSLVEGIDGKTFVDFSSFVNYEDFKQVEPEIMAGIAKCKFTNAIEGAWIHTVERAESSYRRYYKNILEAYEEFKADTIPLDSPVHKWITERDTSLDSKNKLTRYLKSKYGAYDTYWMMHLVEMEYFDVPSDISDHQRAIMQHFPKTTEWINTKLLGNIFETVEKITILYLENDGIPHEHFDGHFDDNMALALRSPYPNNDFVHFRNPRRGFYVFDPSTKNKIFTNSWAVQWNTNDCHSSSRNLYPDWSIRVDGKFSDKVKEWLK